MSPHGTRGLSWAQRPGKAPLLPVGHRASTTLGQLPPGPPVISDDLSRVSIPGARQGASTRAPPRPPAANRMKPAEGGATSGPGSQCPPENGFLKGARQSKSWHSEEAEEVGVYHVSPLQIPEQRFSNTGSGPGGVVPAQTLSRAWFHSPAPDTRAQGQGPTRHFEHTPPCSAPV